MAAGASSDVSPTDTAAELRVLGRLEAAENCRPIDLPAAKARAVLGMLLIHRNQVVSADRLAHGLWGDDRPHSAVNTLQGYVSQLRKALGPGRIHTQSPGYVLSLDPELIDAARFERLFERRPAGPS